MSINVAGNDRFSALSHALSQVVYLPTQRDVPEGLEKLKSLNIPLIALSNGKQEV